MWMYDKKLEYPIKIKRPDPKMAKLIITQYGGPDGELAASLRYLSQRFSMVTPEAKATLNDIGTEELAHLEMVGTMVKQLTQDASIDDIEKSSMAAYYVDHDRAVYPVSAAGMPFTAAYIQSKGDPVTDLHENMAAEQKARSTYEYLINMADDPDVIEPLKFLREREIVHFQRFGESLRFVQEYLENKKRFSMANAAKAAAKANMNMNPSMAMHTEMIEEPGMKLYPSMNRQPKATIMPDMGINPRANANPNMNKAPEMNANPGANKAPYMNVSPSMNIAPEMNANPGINKAPYANAIPGANKAQGASPMNKNK